MAVSRYLDFKIIKEPWSEYELDDGTKIRVRYCLEQVYQNKSTRKDTRLKGSYRVFCSESVCGEPTDITYTEEQQLKNVRKECRPKRKCREPSEYVINEKTKLIINHSIRILKTSLFDKVGDRLYIVDTKALESFENYPNQRKS